MDAICRFCLFTTREDGLNLLIAPCNCKGSTQFIHLECLLEWRRVTVNDECIHTCQLCRTFYRLPTKWPLEDKPYGMHNQLLFLFLRSQFWILLSYYLYYIVTLSNTDISETVLPILNDTYRNEIIERQTTPLEMNPFIFNYICVTITVLYIGVYSRYIIAIKNKRLYCMYWCKRLDQAFIWNPCTILLTSMVSFALMPLLPVISAIYLYMLPQYYVTHCAIIDQMNGDAQL